MKINLLPKDARPLGQYQVRREFLMALVAVVVLAVTSVYTRLELQNVERLKLRHEAALREEFLLQQQVQVVNKLRSEVTALESQQASLIQLLSSKSGSLASVTRVLDHTSPELWIESLTWRPYGFDLQGYTKDMTSLSRYLNFLREFSEEATLKTVNPVEGTSFIVFAVEVRGVASYDPATYN